MQSINDRISMSNGLNKKRGMMSNTVNNSAFKTPHIKNSNNNMSKSGLKT